MVFSSRLYAILNALQSPCGCAAAMIFWLNAVAIESDAQNSLEVRGENVLRAPAGGSEIIITTTSRVAGAIDSVRWQDHEFINSFDHGRQLQSASNLDVDGFLFNEAFNPTEAGSESDADGPTSSSNLLWITASHRDLVSVTQMAFWLKPGAKSGNHAALNSTVVSNHLLTKHLHLGEPDFEHAIRYAVTYTLPANEHHRRATFEAITGYMPFEFSSFHRLLPNDGSLEAIDAGPGEQAHPIVASTSDGRFAMGAWSPDKSRTNHQPCTYGRWHFAIDKVNKWNCVFREISDRGLDPGEYHYVIWVAVGNREQVRSTLHRLQQRHALQQ
ncbi:MAG: hypothetical protein DWH94_06585 [Planctomycetota bacterium]|nr:MAG: hypothetical protein DWH94_06585 [Planctomycetota bacterium]TSA06446.1 MAG: hypothetical protein D4R77_06120 [Planctomycetaceae bacterium]